MSLIADGLLIAAALTAGIYCFVLSRRLKAFAGTESGIGKQIKELTTTLDETRTALKEAQESAAKQSETLARDIGQARKLSTNITNLIANAQSAADALLLARETQPAMAPEPPKPKQPKAAQPIEIAPDPAPPAPEPEPAHEDEDEEIDPGAISFEDALDGEDGEIQLGFLPDDDLDDAEFEDVEFDDGAETAETETEAENLMKVERVAI